MIVVGLIQFIYESAFRIINPMTSFREDEKTLYWLYYAT